MAIAERIYFFRNLRGMTQKVLGKMIGFPERSADVRIAQYESGTRTPKDDVTAALATEMGISPLALTVPDIDTFDGMMHTLFALEDRIGLRVVECDGKAHLLVDPEFSKSSAALSQAIAAWRECAAKLESGEITREDYDNWRYNYPIYATPGVLRDNVPNVRFDPETGTMKVQMTSPEVNDLLAADLKKKKKK